VRDWWFVEVRRNGHDPVMPATFQLVIPVKTGIQEYDLGPGVRRGDEM